MPAGSISECILTGLNSGRLPLTEDASPGLTTRKPPPLRQTPRKRRICLARPVGFAPAARLRSDPPSELQVSQLRSLGLKTTGLAEVGSADLQHAR